MIRKKGLILFALTLPLPLWASSALDEQYSFRRMAIAVLNAEKEPLFSESVENALVQTIQRSSRFELVDAGYVQLKDQLKKGKEIPVLGDKDRKEEDLKTVSPFLSGVAPLGVQSVVFAQLLSSSEPLSYRLRLSLYVAKAPEKVSQLEVPVADPSSLQSFAAAARSGFDELVKAIPFAASVLSREGYRVILDRGSPYFHRGMQVSLYTMDRVGDDFLFQETGMVMISRAEANLAFGRIMAEKKPLEIATGNKIRTALGQQLVDGAIREKGWDGNPSGAVAAESSSGPKNLGTLELNFGASWVTWANSGAGASGLNSKDGMYQGGSLLAELWLTSRWFLDLGFGFSSATLASGGGAGSPELNSSATNLQGQIGYRLSLPILRSQSLDVSEGRARAAGDESRYRDG